MKDTVPAAQVTDLLAAVREALTAPDPAGPYGLYQQLIATRAAYVRGILRSSAEGDLGDVAITIQALREASHDIPVRYEVAGEGEGR